MLRHLRGIHSSSKKDISILKYPCSVCDATLWTKAELEDHIVNKHEKVYSCSFCGIIFRTKDLMKRHENTHKERKKNSMSYLPSRAGR